MCGKLIYSDLNEKNSRSKINLLDKIKKGFLPSEGCPHTPTAFFLLYNGIISQPALNIIRGDFMVYINVTIKGKIDSKELWNDIKGYDVNVTDLGEVTFVYGQASMYDSMFIIDICRKYGDITHEVTSI